MIYLDNAATTWPKPNMVAEAMRDAVLNIGGNPGRSGHKFSLRAGELVERGRKLAANLFGISDPSRLVFALNATDALNLGINGLLKEGDHVISSMMEHNSVARPLAHKTLEGVEVTKIRTDPIGGVDIEELKKAIKENTKLVVMSHASNVTGTLNPIEQIAEVCRNEDVTFLVDASQSAGVIDIDAEKMGIDMIAFPGHKGLLGPTGTGGLYISERVEMKPVRVGGSGADSENPYQPDDMPFHYEAGTQNVPGIAGLCAGIEYLNEKGISEIRKHELKCTDQIIKGLLNIDNVILYGNTESSNRAPVISFNIKGADSQEVAMILDSAFDIGVRAGLHCAPDTHRMLGTFDIGGTVRVSPGCFNTDDDIMSFVVAVESIASEY